MSAIAELKAHLRAEALTRRASLPAEAHRAGSGQAVEHIRPHLRVGETVALFLPIRGEIDPLGLVPDIERIGGTIALPAVEAGGLAFRRFTGAETLQTGPLGTRHPPATAEAARPDLLIVPLAAFDRRGGRIGYGGGYYDRALAALGRGGRAIGIAFACQEVETVPMEPHDVALLAIATELEFIQVRERAVRLLFLGDVVGRSGRSAVTNMLPGLIERHRFDFVVVNGENAAGGFGVTEEIVQSLLDAGADCVTTGNHVWDQREALVFADRQDRFLRPLNYPPGTPGRGSNVYVGRNGARVLVLNVMGAIFMPSLDDPFATVAKSLAACSLGNGCDVVIVDVHAEATSEKQTMGHFLDGKVSLVVGTHTHVPTADHRILPGGTGFVTDVGMCGDYDSVIGMDKEEPLRRSATKIPSGRLGPALGPATLSGVALDIDDATGLARRIMPLRIGPSLEAAEPVFD